jgi:tetratricopeptide (TPR) repeat protein
LTLSVHSGEGERHEVTNIVQDVEGLLSVCSGGHPAGCNEAILLNPELALAYSNRASAYNGKGEFDWAIADFGEAIRLDPKIAYTTEGR